MRTVRPIALLGVAAALTVPWTTLTASAQPGRQWLVVPSVVADGGDVSVIPRRTAELLERTLPAPDVTVISASQARTRFEQHGSSAPMLATHSDLDALARDAQQALYHVASGLPSRARQDVERALLRATNVIESLNRETRAAQHLLDACLYLVRAQLESGQRDEAREQALQCRRLVPDIEPDGTMHPPDVIGVLAEAEAHLRQREPGSLRVESSPSGCAVYVNGRMLGTSPLELPDLSPGEYRVQVECRDGHPGRVHRTVLAAGRVVKRIDTRFDSALQTGLDTSVQYGSYPDQAGLAVEHATEIGRVVGANDVLLVTQLTAPAQSEAATVLIRRIQVADGKVVAAVKVHIGDDGETAHAHHGRLLSDLHNARFSDLTKQEPRVLASSEYEAEALAVGGAPLSQPVPRAGPMSPATDPETSPVETHPVSADLVDRLEHSSPSVFGWTLGAAGAAAVITGWGLYAYQLKLEADYQDADPGSDGYYTALNAVDSFQFAPLVTTFAGVAFASAALPIVLPEHDGIPPWSLAMGGAGLLTAGVGTYFAYAGTTCDQFDTRAKRCTDDLLVTHVGYMLLLTAVPLLTVPIVYMTRGATEYDSRVTVHIDREGLGLNWAGAM